MKTHILIPNLASTHRALSIFIGANAVLLASQSARAASGTWTNTVSGDVWSLPANWNLESIADGANSTADFSTLDIDADTTVSLDSARTIGNLAFGDAITPSNNWLLDNGGVAGNVLTLAATATPSISVSNQSATLGLVLAGSTGFAKTGSGNLILTGTNTLTGSILISEGTLSIGTGNVVTATAGSGRIFMSNGTTFRLNTTSAGIFLSNSITISGANANATITSGVLSSGYTGSVFGSSDQTLTIGDANVSFNGSNQQLAGFSGTFVIGSGKNIRYSSTGVTSNAGNADVGGANTTFLVDGSISARNAFAGIHLGALSGSGALNGGGSSPSGVSPWIIGEKNTDSAFQGTINNGGTSTSSLIKRGTGTLTLDGANPHTYTNVTNVNRGTLRLDFVNLVTPTNLINSSSTLGLGGGTFSIKGQATDITTQTFAGANVSAGASTIALDPNGGTATDLNLTGIARSQGGTVNYTPVAGGTVNTTTANSNFTGGQQTILGGYATVDGNTWAVSGTGDTPGAISGLATPDYSNTSVTALSAAGTLDVDVAAAGTNTTGGALTVNSLRFDDSTAATTLDATGGLLTVATGGILVTSNVGANPITISGGSLTSGTNTGADIIVHQNNTAAPLTISSVVAGTRRFTKSGAGTVIITGANTITGGGTHINGGTLQLGDGSAAAIIGGAGNSMNLNGGTLALNLPNGTNYTNSVVNISTGSGIRNLAATGDVRLVGAYVSNQGPATLNLSSEGGQITHPGTESGFTGTIAMTGAAAFSYRFNSASSNPNTGSTTTLYDLGTNANIMTSRNGGLASTLTINLGGLQGGPATTLRGAGSDAAAGQTNAMTFSIGALNLSTVFDGVITNGTAAATNGGTPTVAITKVGIGTLTLANANTYTGATAVNAGTLRITGSITSAVAVNGNGTLSGSGSITGNVQVNSGGRIASAIAATAGAQVPLAITGTLTVNSGNILDLTAAAAPADGVYKLVTATGGVAYTPGSVNLAGVAGTVSVSGNDLILTVGSSGYGGWASVNANNQTADRDFDDDGTPNGIEYFMNAPAGFTASPGVVGGAVTWVNGGSIPSTDYGTRFFVETSPNLVIWTPVPMEDLTTNTSGPGGSLIYTLPTGAGTIFARLVVTPN